MDDKKTVGIIVVNYNGIKDTLACIKSIEDSSTNYVIRVIIVDNCSIKNELANISNKYPDIICIQSDINGGFSYGNNLGIRWAIENGCDYIMLLNNDTVVKDDMIDILIDACDSQIVTPTMFYYGTENKVWYAGGYINKKTGNAKHKRMNEHVDIKNVDNEICTFTTGCCFAAKTDTIKKLGYLDDSYFMYCEDTDYCIRAALNGIQIEYIPNAVLWHKISQSTGGSDSPFATYYMTRNRLNYLKKYRTYFVFCAYWFSLVTRIWRMLTCKNYALKVSYWNGIKDHIKGVSGNNH